MPKCGSRARRGSSGESTRKVTRPVCISAPSSAPAGCSVASTGPRSRRFTASSSGRSRWRSSRRRRPTPGFERPSRAGADRVGYSIGMGEHWYREAIVYCLDVDTFQDSNSDGIGDLRGLISRLDYLAGLGVTCLWLNPIHPSPRRDDGYDVADHYGVQPEIGSLGDFVELVHKANNLGLRIIIDLVINHTSNEHKWFQEARARETSPYRDWYVWSHDEPADRKQGMVFPGVQESTWTYDRKARAWYYHRFYDFEPDLNMANPDVRAEIDKIIGFWLQLGVAGFRLDAAPFVIELTVPNDSAPRKDFAWLSEFRRRSSWRRGDALILAEANVDKDELAEYFGSGDRLPMLFNFLLNARTFLALARADASP